MKIMDEILSYKEYLRYYIINKDNNSNFYYLSLIEKILNNH